MTDDDLVDSDEYTSQLSLRVGNILGVQDDVVPDVATDSTDSTWCPKLRSGHDYTSDFTVGPEKVYEDETDRDLQG